jgi:hypothetical protein
VASKDEAKNQLTDTEISCRMEKAIRRSLQMPPKLHKDQEASPFFCADVRAKGAITPPSQSPAGARFASRFRPNAA